jgi:hypothetical protein
MVVGLAMGCVEPAVVEVAMEKAIYLLQHI